MRLAILTCLFMAVLAGGRGSAQSLVNGIAVIVGDSVITLKDVHLAMRDDLRFLEERYGNQPEVLREKALELERQTLETMVENRLVLQEFERAGYMVPETYIKSRIEDDIEQHGDRLTLIQTLQEQGFTFESYRKRIRERTILELMWREKVPRDPLISPAKIENYYVQNRDKFKLEDQVKLRMIVLTNNPSSSSYSPQKLAEELMGKLDQNVPFTELARVYSQDSYAASGGERGWLEKSQLRKELADAAFALERGEHAMVPIAGAIYIIQVADKKVSYTQSLSEVRDEIEATLKAEENRRLRKQWVEQLKKKTFVQYF